jgi:hypothetical protein
MLIMERRDDVVLFDDDNGSADIVESGEVQSSFLSINFEWQVHLIKVI